MALNKVHTDCSHFSACHGYTVLYNRYYDCVRYCQDHRCHNCVSSAFSPQMLLLASTAISPNPRQLTSQPTAYLRKRISALVLSTHDIHGLHLPARCQSYVSAVVCLLPILLASQLECRYAKPDSTTQHCYSH